MYGKNGLLLFSICPSDLSRCDVFHLVNLEEPQNCSLLGFKTVGISLEKPTSANSKKEETLRGMACSPPLGYKCCLEYSLRTNLVLVTRNELIGSNAMKSSALLLNNYIAAISRANLALWKGNSQLVWGCAAHYTCPVLGPTTKTLSSVTWSEGTSTNLISHGPLNNH